MPIHKRRATDPSPLSPTESIPPPMTHTHDASTHRHPSSHVCTSIRPSPLSHHHTHTLCRGCATHGQLLQLGSQPVCDVILGGCDVAFFLLKRGVQQKNSRYTYTSQERRTGKRTRRHTPSIYMDRVYAFLRTQPLHEPVARRGAGGLDVPRPALRRLRVFGFWMSGVVFIIPISRSNERTIHISFQFDSFHACLPSFDPLEDPPYPGTRAAPSPPRESHGAGPPCWRTPIWIDGGGVCVTLS